MIFIALDDERPALKSLCASIKKVQSDAEIHEFNSAIDVLEFAKTNSFDAAFLDIQGMDMDGVSLAKQLKALKPKSNIIFCTGYSEFALDAFDINASGYLLKPITPDKISKALSELRYETNADQGNINKKVFFRCFGNFEIFVNEKPLDFKYSKSKELVALLFDKRGAMCSNNEIMANLWEDDEHQSYLKQLRKDIDDTFTSIGCANLILKQPGKLAIAFNEIDSDLKDWQEGKLSGINAYRGEYMAQYSWAEETNGFLMDY